jgi:hypothetical protein
VSYSMLEPEWEPICECKYDPVHDRMDREDCFFHCDMADDVSMPEEHQPEEQQPQEPQTLPKKPAAAAKSPEENAA